MKKIPAIFAIAALLHCCPAIKAQGATDSLCLKVFFRENVTTIDPEYRNNGILIDQFVSEVKEIMADTTCRIQSIHIRSGASPEGRFDHNKDLSVRRGNNLRTCLQRALPLPEHKFTVDAVGEDWATLRDIIENSDAPDREDILYILDSHARYIYGRPRSVNGGPKKELMDFKGGKTWRWLLDNVFPDLRSAGNSIVCRYEHITEPEAPAPVAAPAPRRGNDTLVIIHKYVFDIDTAKIADFPVKMETVIPTGVNVKDSARTIIGNSLIDATFAPKVEIAVPDGKNASIEVDNKVVIPQKK